MNENNLKLNKEWNNFNNVFLNAIPFEIIDEITEKIKLEKEQLLESNDRTFNDGDI